MTIQLAKEILERLGGGRIVHVNPVDDVLVRELRLNGCAASPDRLDGKPVAGAIDALVIDLPGDEPAGGLMIILQHYPEVPNIAVRAPIAHRPQVEARLFAAGWRRHPAGLLVYEYESFDDARMPPVGYYERIPAAAAALWRVEDLLEDRGLHMDMLRESGCRADAHIVRYSLAAQYVRPGDRVLDCACGLGYGTAVLAALSRGADYLGVDLDPLTAEYAQANYGKPGLSYMAGDASLLDGVADASIDMVVSMETIEHVPDWPAALKAFKRVLKPDGRLVCSVPDRWMDETGEDPNPHHFHVFDWAKLSDALSELFIVEAKFVQAAPGGFKLPDAARQLRRTPLDGQDDTEWLLAVASANPFEGEQQKDAYVHPQFGGRPGSAPPTVVDFGGAYDNPFLYRVLIQMGERLTDDDKLFRLALWVANNAREDSPDRGGAIAVLGYRVLEARSEADVANVLGLIESYMSSGAIPGGPHTERWRLSLAFLAGRLTELAGDPGGAMSWYAQAVERGWRSFSPLLATKVVGASFFEGRLHLFSGDEAAARASFERGVREAMEALSAPPREIIGDYAEPLAFGMQELAEVADMGSQCANALTHLHLWKRSPGLYWRQIDTRRFGLASWAKDLEQENERLRNMAR